MITRIVRMHFTNEGVQLFNELFKKHRVAMSSVEGCLSLELFRDPEKPTSFVTISKWENEHYLEAYRNSALFLTIWKKIKPYFSERADAFSLTEVK